MPVFSNELLLRFFKQGEDNLAHERNFIADRYSIPVVSGTSAYTLPDYILSIRRVTYLGTKLDPLPYRDFREVFQSATQQGKPYWYIYNNVGINKIQLFPTPNQNVASVTNVWTTEIATGCIVEYYRSADGATYVLPSYIRRQLLKLYVARQCFAVEGAGQNIKMVKYFDARWTKKKAEWFALLDELYSKPRKLVVGMTVDSGYFPASPVLPINRYGISCDD